MLLILKNFSKLFSFINIISGYICAFLVFLMFVNVFGVVVLRYLFDISFIWMQETYVWMHAIIFMVASGYTYLYDEHVRIDIIYRDASLKYKRIVNFIGHICFLLPFMYQCFQTPVFLPLSYSPSISGSPIRLYFCQIPCLTPAKYSPSILPISNSLYTRPVKRFFSKYISPFDESNKPHSIGSFAYRKEKDNPVDEYIRRLDLKLVPPLDTIRFNKYGNEVNLTTQQYNKLTSLIPFIKISYDEKGRPFFDPQNGKRFPEIILELSRNKNNIKALKELEADSSGGIDAQGMLTRKEIIRKELQQPVRTFWKDYKKVAVEYYKEYIMDKKIKSMAENENRRAYEDIIPILENFSGN